MVKKNILSNQEIVTVSLYILGQGLKGFSCEEIATKADEIAPGRFRWKTNANMISDSVTWDALSNARKKNYLHEKTDNYFLTDEGINFAKENLNKLNFDQKKIRISSSDLEQINNIKARLIGSTAYKKIQENKKITNKEYNNFFRINNYMSEKQKNEKIEKLINMFLIDKQLNQIIKKIKESEVFDE